VPINPGFLQARKRLSKDNDLGGLSGPPSVPVVTNDTSGSPQSYFTPTPQLVVPVVECHTVITGYITVTTTYDITVAIPTTYHYFDPLSDQWGTVSGTHYETTTYSVTTNTPIYGTECTISSGGPTYGQPYKPPVEEISSTSSISVNQTSVDTYDLLTSVRESINNEQEPYYDDTLGITGELPSELGGDVSLVTRDDAGMIPLSSSVSDPVGENEPGRVHKPSLQIRMDLTDFQRQQLQQYIPGVDLEQGYALISRSQLQYIWFMTRDGSLSVDARNRLLELLSTGATYFYSEIIDTDNNTPGYIQEY